MEEIPRHKKYQLTALGTDEVNNPFSPVQLSKASESKMVSPQLQEENSQPLETGLTKTTGMRRVKRFLNLE